jgi:multimeric flavodoxin WrbA
LEKEMNFDDYLNFILEGIEGERLSKTINYLKTKENILFLTTSNRSDKVDDKPKSTILAEFIAKKVGEDKVKIIKVPDLNIYNCTGNVSIKDGNSCGIKDALLKDKDKNPSGYHRCWVSWANKDDELWKISKPLFESDTVVFFGSVRWGQMNAYYQKIIERLDWIENRHTTLGEDNIIENIDAGLICIGQNWNGKVVIETQKKVLDFYGFKTPDELFWNWQFTEDAYDESKESYKKAYPAFKKEFNI